MPLFYIALNKKPALVALFKAVNNTTLYNFLRNDFSESKWITSALANAYTLMSKQRFELAAAFFLLGGKLKDAIGVCLQKLGDYQLALLLARLVEGESSPAFESVLIDYVLPLAKQTGDASLASISYWLLKKYSDSILSLVPTPDSDSSGIDAKKKGCESSKKFNPSVLHLFDTLRSHTMLRETSLNLDDLRFDLMKKSALSFTDTGYTLLALEQLKELKEILDRSKASKSEVPTTSSFMGGALGRFRRPVIQESSSSSSDSPKISTEKSIGFTFLHKVALQLLSQVVYYQRCKFYF